MQQKMNETKKIPKTKPIRSTLFQSTHSCAPSPIEVSNHFLIFSVYFRKAITERTTRSYPNSYRLRKRLGRKNKRTEASARNCYWKS